MLHYPKWWQVVADNTSFWCAPLLLADLDQVTHDSLLVYTRGQHAADS